MEKNIEEYDNHEKLKMGGEVESYKKFETRFNEN